jgi:hypothetical protein
MLQDKKVLFIAPPYFDYPEIIKSGIEAHGAKVDLFYSQPVDAFSRFISVFNNSFYERLKKRYFKVLHEKIKGPFDFVLIIRADLIPGEFLEFLRHKNHNTFFIQYLWDDIEFFPALLDSYRFFDRILSYSVNDSKKYGLVFRPFFFIPNAEPENRDPGKKYDLFFIGIFHTDRLSLIEKAINLNPEVSFYHHFYINPITFFKAGIPFRKLKLFRFRKMGYQEMIRMVKQSSAILDIPKPSQQGLSTRILEALGAGTKVITTNENVRNYEFFNDNNFLIIDREKPMIEYEWITLPFAEYDKGLLSRYNISKWIEDVYDIGV